MSIEVARAIRALLEKAGTTGILASVTPGAYDETTGATAAEATSLSTVYLALTSYKNSEIDGESVLRQDRKATISAHNLAAIPQVGDRLTVGGISYNVLDVSPRVAAGAAVAYTCQVRKGG